MTYFQACHNGSNGACVSCIGLLLRAYVTRFRIYSEYSKILTHFPFDMLGRHPRHFISVFVFNLSVFHGFTSVLLISFSWFVTEYFDFSVVCSLYMCCALWWDFAQLIHALSIMASAATNSAKKYDPNPISLDHSSVCIGSWCPPICFGNKVNDLVDQRAQLGNQCFEISINVHNCSCSAVSPATDKCAFFSPYAVVFAVERKWICVVWMKTITTYCCGWLSIRNLSNSNEKYSLFTIPCDE